MPWLLNVNDTDTTTSAVQHQYAYAYDASGNRTSKQIDGNSVTSSYNNNNQLTGQSGGGSLVFAGTLNKPGTVTVGGNAAVMSNGQTGFRSAASVTQNMTNNVPVVATNLNGYATTNTYHVFVPSTTSSSISYDYNGNLLTDGTRTFTYDAKDEMVKIAYTGGAYSTFTYNGLGQRVAIQEYNSGGTLTSTKQYVAGEERNAGNYVTKRYFAHGEQIVSGSTVTSYFYTRDHLGSIREVVDSSSTVQAVYAYDPYGRATQVSGSFSSDFQFTGYYYHATSGLYLSATRAYNPNLGRFIQRDPSGESSGLNLYAYCSNSPINYVDPSGLDPNSFADPSVLKNPFSNPSAYLLTFDLPSSAGCMDDNPLNPLDPYNQALDPSAIGNAQNLSLNLNGTRSTGTPTDPYFSHYGGPWDPSQDGAGQFNSGSNSTIPTGNHNNPLTNLSLAISQNVARANGLKVGGPVYVNGIFLGNYDDTAPKNNTIDIYDPTNAVWNVY